MKDYFKVPITSKQEAEEFLRMLYTDDLGFHPEDSAHNIMIDSPCPSEGGPDTWVSLFTSEEADLLDNRMDEVHEVMSDPCEFILNEIR